MLVLSNMRRYISKGRQYFAKGGILPIIQSDIEFRLCNVPIVPCEQLVLVCGWQSTIFEEIETMKASNFDECSDEKRCCLAEVGFS
jgi:hypothetical protein